MTPLRELPGIFKRRPSHDFQLMRLGVVIHLDAVSDDVEHAEVGDNLKQVLPEIRVGTRQQVHRWRHARKVPQKRTGRVRLDYRPVHTYTMTNEVKYIEPQTREY